MEKEYELNIYDLITVTVDFLQNLEDPDAIQKYLDYRKKMRIREYMPLFQKETLLRKVLLDIKTVDDTPYNFVVAKEIAVLFDCLLAYVENMDPNIPAALKDFSTYDIIYASELPKYILDFCEDDYGKMLKLIDEVISVDNIQNIMKNIDYFDGDKLDNLTKAFENFTLKIDNKELDKIDSLLNFNDSFTKNISDSLKESAITAARKAASGDDSAETTK